MAKSSATTLLFFSSSLLVLLLMSGHVYTEPIQDKQVLLAFISRVAHASRVHWNASDSACNWFGVGCDYNLSSVYYLRLPAVGLVGRIPDNTLGRLSQLRVLSFRSNGLWGPIPSDFTNLTLLRALYLQDNQLSGAFPSSFTKLPWLARLDLSSNNFTGSIPFAVNNMTHLTGLFLEKNGFFGNLPSINPTNLTNFNVSNNRLNGSIPVALTRFPASAFAGNIELCGGPLPPCNFFFQSPQPSPSGEFLPPPPSLLNGSKRRLSTGTIIGIAIGAAVAVLVLLFILLLCLRRRTETKQQPTTITKSPSTVVEEMGTSSSKEDIAATSAAQAERDMNKLVFVEGGVYSFDLEDLLRASAEVLGKGSLGTSYKAVLEAGTTVVVKRLKNVVVTRAEFEELMHALGNIKHENLVPLRAYYYSKDEKLLLYDYMPAGSLSASLHGSRGSGRTTLDWDSRMRVASSAARGLAYLHLLGNVVHGDVKSSNILLQQDSHDACLSDFGLNPLFGGSTTSSSHRVTGYRVPEMLETHKVTFKSDVYSFGVLLLELLTGKSPNQASLGEDGIDLPRWVQSVVREEWTEEVFDVELMRYHNIEEEMVQLLQIAMSCVALVPDQRPAMQEVVKMIKEINRAETDDGLKQSDDPSKVSDSDTPPQEPRTSPYCFRP